MDRTREFRLIVESTEIPQNSFKASPFYLEALNLNRRIKDVIDQTKSLTHYESFKTQALLSQGYSCTKELKQIQVESSSEEIKESLKNIIRNMVLKNTLKLNDIRNKMTIPETSSSQPTDVTQTKSQIISDSLLIQEENKQENEFIQERRRIVKSISEIGQIVENISIHVSMQEEQLKRIDDVVRKSETFGKKALNELRLTWEMTSENRKTIIKFFAFFIFLILFFYFIR